MGRTTGLVVSLLMTLVPRVVARKYQLWQRKPWNCAKQKRSPESCNNATTTLHNTADALALAACKTFTGDVVIATEYAPTVLLNGVEEVIGSVILANNSQVTTAAADSLKSVTNDVVLDTLPLLANISLPMWSSVNTLILNKIPAPNALNMQTTVQQVTNLYITDTTLETLFGLLLQSAQMDNLQITGNKYLSNCWFGVGNVTQQVTILDNSGTMALTLPNLTYAYNINISNASSVDIPLLKSVSQSLDISWNTFQNLSLPNLSYVGQEVNIANNAEMTELALDDLVNVQGGFSLVSNAQLEDLGGLSRLNYIGGNLNLDGDFVTYARFCRLHGIMMRVY
jgi:hypothetical protein